MEGRPGRLGSGAEPSHAARTRAERDWTRISSGALGLRPERRIVVWRIGCDSLSHRAHRAFSVLQTTRGTSPSTNHSFELPEIVVLADISGSPAPMLRSAVRPFRYLISGTPGPSFRLHGRRRPNRWVSRPLARSGEHGNSRRGNRSRPATRRRRSYLDGRGDGRPGHSTHRRCSPRRSRHEAPATVRGGR